MLISLNEALRRQDHIVAFNFFNLETLSNVVKVADELGVSAILAFGESYIRRTPLPIAAAMATEYAELARIPFVLHLDHATDIRTIEDAIALGFSSVMFDGSRLPLEENIRRTREVVDFAHGSGVSVEGELGYLNKEDGTGQSRLECTGVDESALFVAETGVDALAVAVGNAHGVYKEEPRIDLVRIREIHDRLKVPLVLHGSSGIPPEVLVRCFGAGVKKINVNTEIALSASRGALEYLAEHGDSSRFENVMDSASRAIENAVRSFMVL